LRTYTTQLTMNSSFEERRNLFGGHTNANTSSIAKLQSKFLSPTSSPEPIRRNFTIPKNIKNKIVSDLATPSNNDAKNQWGSKVVLKHVTSKPAEPVELKPVELKPVELKPVELTPVELTPVVVTNQVDDEPVVATPPETNKAVEKHVRFATEPIYYEPLEQPETATCITTTSTSNTDQCAIQIQRLVRGWRQRLAYRVACATTTTSNTDQCAIQIQRLVRGWWQRLHYRAACLERRIAQTLEQKNQQLQEIQRSTQERKDEHLKESMTICKQHVRKERQLVALAGEIFKVNDFLTRNNKQTREDNNALASSIKELKERKVVVARANGRMIANLDLLKKHSSKVEARHEKLKANIPKYEDGIEKLQEMLNDQQMECMAESKAKYTYMRFMGAVVANLNKAPHIDQDMLFDIMDLCMEAHVEDRTNPVGLQICISSPSA
jgi:hypothetical protein